MSWVNSETETRAFEELLSRRSISKHGPERLFLRERKNKNLELHIELNYGESMFDSKSLECIDSLIAEGVSRDQWPHYITVSPYKIISPISIFVPILIVLSISIIQFVHLLRRGRNPLYGSELLYQYLIFWSIVLIYFICKSVDFLRLKMYHFLIGYWWMWLWIFVCYGWLCLGLINTAYGNAPHQFVTFYKSFLNVSFVE